MSNHWGPYFIVPSESLRKFSGAVRLREQLDEELMYRELKELGISGAVVRITNPWYYRKKGTETWIKVGESDDKQENFAVRWDTTRLENGRYEVLGLMHVMVEKGDDERVIARQNVVEVSIDN